MVSWMLGSDAWARSGYDCFVRFNVDLGLGLVQSMSGLPILM
jgi:hypothetical protein